MKAIHLPETGGVENFTPIQINTPTPKEGEVLIQTKAIGINPVDWKVRAMQPVLEMIVGKTSDVILGRDIAGVVSAVGEGVSDFKEGDRVFGMVNFPGEGKAYAEYVSAPANHLAHIPESISDNEAAASTLAALTALQALQGRVKSGDKVLIHAGSGGVGHYAIQIAKSMGAYVITTCSSKNKEFVMGLGANEHIDYRTSNFEEVVSDVDFILDGLGGDVLVNSLKCVKNGGTIISLPSPQFPEGVSDEAKNRNVTVLFILVESKKEDIETIADLLSQNKIKAHVAQTFSFDKIGDAHNAIESGRTVGKIVVTV